MKKSAAGVTQNSLMNGMASAPEPGAFTTRASFISFPFSPCVSMYFSNKAALIAARSLFVYVAN